jgi:hypothetical protein
MKGTGGANITTNVTINLQFLIVNNKGNPKTIWNLVYLASKIFEFNSFQVENILGAAEKTANLSKKNIVSLVGH